MATYFNGYALLEKLWIQLVGYGPNIAGYLSGTDTTGPYSNPQIMDGINDAQRFLYSTLMTRIPYEFEEEVSLTGVSSVYTLPANFGTLRYFKDSDGLQIHPIKTDHRRITGRTGSDQRYYRKGNTLVIDQANVTEICTLIYSRKSRDIEQGKATGGGALSITFATSAKKIVDYYTGLIIENDTKDWVDTITGYTTGRVATIAETAATDDYYGTVSDIPEPFHFLLVPRALFEITGKYPIVKEKPNVSGIELFNQDFLATLRAYAGNTLDEYVEDIWCDYSGGLYGYNYDTVIPGH